MVTKTTWATRACAAPGAADFDTPPAVDGEAVDSMPAAVEWRPDPILRGIRVLARLHATGRSLGEALDRIRGALLDGADVTEDTRPDSLTMDSGTGASIFAALAELSVSAVSHQLRLLRDRDLVRARRDGRMVYYSVTDDHISTLIGTGVEHANE